MTRLALILLLLTLPAQAADISGTARAVDGDTIRIDGQRVRLCGIAAPETNTHAGQAGRAAMASLVDGKRVYCTLVGNGTPCDGRSPAASYGRPVMQCFVHGLDIAAMMVTGGHAQDWHRYSGGHYAACEAAKGAPTDSNLHACFGAVPGGHW